MDRTQTIPNTYREGAGPVGEFISFNICPLHIVQMEFKSAESSNANDIGGSLSK